MGAKLLNSRFDPRRELVAAIEEAPSTTGVYVFKDSQGRILYVGKAKSLRSRLRSYLNLRHLTPKIRHMVSRAVKVEWMETASELEAFILESNLIKAHRPPYNVMLKDDKRYPYLRLALSEAYPYLELVRRPQKDGSLYYGPYVPAWAVRETMSLLSQIFPLRRCRGPLKKQSRPCLNFQMGRCLGPCARPVDHEEYADLVEGVRRVLEGKGREVLEELQKRMEALAGELRFEEAARVRDQIFALQRIMERQRVLLTGEKDLDFILWEGDGRFYLFLLMVRRGMLLGEKGFVLEAGDGLEAFFREFYGRGREIPPRIVLVPSHPAKGTLQEWLTHLKGEKVLVTMGRGEERVLLSLAREKLVQFKEEWGARRREMEDLLVDLSRLLRLSQVPRRIEAYDVSNLVGREAVGSMVTFVDGEPAKEDYRHFTIRTVEGIDDYAMMREVLRRRLEHGEWELPQLVLIDGGRGHVEAAREVLEDKGVEGVEVRSLAKERGERFERIYFPGETEPLVLEPSSPVTHFLQRIRDEAHRFGITHHRRKRGKERLTSLLEQIPGVGPVRRRRLLQVFGSLDAIAEASVDDLASVPGITPVLAMRIKDFLEEYLKG